jgi:hypothetical protein
VSTPRNRGAVQPNYASEALARPVSRIHPAPHGKRFFYTDRHPPRVGRWRAYRLRRSSEEAKGSPPMDQFSNQDAPAVVGARPGLGRVGGSAGGARWRHATPNDD